MKSTEIFVFRQDRTDQMTVKGRKIKFSQVKSYFQDLHLGHKIKRSLVKWLTSYRNWFRRACCKVVKRLLNFRIDDISY